MANIIITLPGKLWWGITHGVKMYECRKALPKITIDVSKVYVILKKTHHVVGYFTITNVISTNNFSGAWHDYGKHLFISQKWFMEYVEGYSGIIHLWKIGRVYRFDDTVDLEEFFGVKKNPQSYVYTNANPCVRQSLMKVLDLEKNKLVSPKVRNNEPDDNDLGF